MSSERIILFDGTNLDNWHSVYNEAPKWTVCDGYTTVTPYSGSIVSNVEYGDAHIHLEFKTPDMPDKTGQDKGNSGVFIHACYEIQVLDSFGINPPTRGDCAAIYGMFEPLTNACLPPDEWQSYDIYFRAPRFDGDRIIECARLTLLHNGVVVHNNIDLPGHTGGGLFGTPPARGPLMLQDHADQVSYRNIWIQPL